MTNIKIQSPNECQNPNQKKGQKNYHEKGKDRKHEIEGFLGAEYWTLITCPEPFDRLTSWREPNGSSKDRLLFIVRWY